MENKSINKNQMRILLVKELLYNLTDENHYVSVADILRILKEEHGLDATRKTIYSDVDILIDYGCDIECVHARNNQYHVVSRDFETAELKFLIDSVESSRSLSTTKSKALVRKIASLSGTYQAQELTQYTNVEGRHKTENNQVYYIIDTVNKAILKKRKIVFKYYEYLTSRERVEKHDGAEYTVSPYRLLMSGDYYYLIGYSDTHKKVVTFRVDRISGMPKVKRAVIKEMPSNIDIEEYIKDSFRTLGSDKVQMDLIFADEMMDALIDRFGEDLIIKSSDKGWTTCTLFAPANSAFFGWLFGFDGRVRLLGPESVKMQYVRMVSREMARL